MNSSYRIIVTKQAKKDIQTLSPALGSKAKDILVNLLAENRFAGKKLLGKLEGNYSCRLSLKDRIIYSIDEKKRCIYVKTARTHYGD